MWVASVVRGTDVAERLVRTALRAASDAGVRRVVLDVAHENARAWAFYSRMGFRPTGEVNSMPWDSAVTEEQMVLDLTARS
jgi:ribosomal protein S18 acetylase RimI-like enzyme